MKSIITGLGLFIAVGTAAAGATAQLNEQRNLYFVDTHGHTALSFDGYLGGNRFGLEDTYRFAPGRATDPGHRRSGPAVAAAGFPGHHRPCRVLRPVRDL
jgi:hypothetical protein